MKYALNNEKGSISLLFALGVAVVGALMVVQMGSAFSGVNKLHADRRVRLSTAQAMERLSLLFQQSYHMAQIDTSCSSFGKGVKRQTINGASFCVPTSGLCATAGGDGEANLACAAADAPSLQWNTPGDAGRKPSMEPAANNPNSPKTASSVSNQIALPAASSPLRRSCTSGVCVRVALCPAGKTTCTVSQAQAVQILRLGTL